MKKQSKTTKVTASSKATKATPKGIVNAPAVVAPVTVTAPPAIVKVPVARTAEMRTASALKAAATKTPEQRSNAAKTAWVTIRANRAALAAAQSVAA